MKYEDFKYVIQDFSTVQIGAKFTYEEMLLNDRIPFKLQSIIRLYILKEVSGDKELDKHILEMDESSFTYSIYSSLKIKIRFCEPNPKGGFKNIQKKFVDFKKYQESNWTDENIIQDITISNLSLMGFNI